MKKIFPALMILLVMGACLPFSIPGLATPTVLIPTTVAPPSATSSPLPSPTPVLVNPTETPPGVPPLASETASPLPPANLTATIVTATNFPLNPTSTATPPPLPGQPTASPTLGIRLYGTLPPEVPFTDITIWNKSRTEAYISLQVTLNDGRYSILEYPVKSRVKIKAPLGSYVYVAWVGGNKMVGGFKLHAGDGIVIYLYKDRVEIPR
jgi:hypothetical protein